jgi:WD40 repeat protein
MEARFVSLARPYKGLAAFDDSDLDVRFFFGRERETEVIGANVMASRLTVLYGPLGVGKSSVLRAGVSRRLRSLAPDAVVAVFNSWSGDAAAGLQRAVAHALGVEQPPPDVTLADGLAELAAGSGGDLYLLLDQFEEVFVYPGAEVLAASLAEVVTQPGLRVNLLLALRQDALSELDVFTGRIPNVFGNYLALDRLDRAAARTAITGPIARYNELAEGGSVEIEDELVEAVLDQVAVGRVLAGDDGRGPDVEAGSDQVEAPYLQLVMERLWDAEERRGSRVLRLQTLEELGGAQAIVRAHLGEAVGALAPGERDVAARIFNHLVTPSGTKIAHGPGDLAEYAGVTEEELRPVLESLGASRILRPADGRFEIYHDVLADAVLAWRARHEGERALERQRGEAKRRHRRLLALLVTSLLALAVMTAVTVYAFTQRSEARDQAELARAEATSAKASELAAQASVLIPITAPEADPELGLLLAAEAARLSPTSQTAGVLRRALLLSHLRVVLPELDVTSASFSPDGERIAIGTAEGLVRLYTGDARRSLMTLRLGGPATGASFSPDGRLVLTTEEGGPARIWDAGAGTELRSLGRAPTEASFSSDGSLVLTAEAGGARVWKTDDGSAVAALRQTEAVRHASFGPGAERIVAVGEGNLARVFDVRTGRLVAVVNHGGPVASATLTPDERGLVTTGGGRAPRLWSLRRGGRLVRELPGRTRNVTAAVVAPDGDLVVTTGTDGIARAWALDTGRLIAIRGHKNRIGGAAFSRDGLSVVTWSADGTAFVWEPAGGGSARVALAGHGGAVTSAAFDPSGDTVLTTSENGLARLWSSRVRDQLEVVAGVPTPIAAASVSEDGSVAAVAGRSVIRISKASDGEQIGVLPAGPVRVLALSRDGSLVSAARGDRIVVWRAATGDQVGALTTPGQATAIAFSPDARRLAVGTASGTIAIWTLGTPDAAPFAAPGQRVTSIAFDPTGASLAAGLGNGTVLAWSVRERRRLLQGLEHRRGTSVTSVVFSSEGRRLVTAGTDSTVRVWNVATGQAPYALRGHYGKVGDAAFSPNGQWLVTAGPSNAGLWDLASRQRFLFLRGHDGRVLATSFDGVGRTVLTIGVDGTLRSYRCEVCGGVPELLQVAERRMAATGRTLTSAERRLYLEEN